MTTLSQPAAELCTQLEQHALEELSKGGSCWPETAVVCRTPVTVQLHSGLGPSGQLKQTNEDFAVAWLCDESSDGLHWALAMADGVTSSYFAAAAARIACWTALSHLVRQYRTGAELETKHMRGMESTHVVGSALGEVAACIESAGEAARPANEFAATWRYTLQQGLLLQTTLTLAWQDAGELHVASIGDGAGLLELNTPAGKSRHALGESDLGTDRVHALGPRNQHPECDVLSSFHVDGPFRLALYTDGVGRGLQLLETDVFEALNDEAVNHIENPARHLIETWSAQSPDEFSDNLSLAIVSRP